MKQFVMPIAVAIMFSLPAGSWAAGRANPLFEDIDTDKNGTISSEEFINAPLGFKKTRDGKKFLQKLIPATSGKETDCIPLTTVEKQKLFNSLDKDKNHTIDRKEWVIFRDGKFLF